MNVFSQELDVVLDQQYIVNAEYKVVYDHVGHACAAIRGFIPPYVREG